MPGKKILLVEDDLFLREIYVDSLKGEGFDLDTAADGDEALNKLKIPGWDLVLLDIRLPKMTGFDIIDILKKDPDFKLPNIVFLTGMDNEADIQKALEVGKGYLIKSQITPGDLVKEVKMYLGEKDSS